MSCFQKNIELLGIKDGGFIARHETFEDKLDENDYRIIKCKDGKLSVKRRGKLLHSAYSPMKQATAQFKDKDFAKRNVFLFYGLGFAYNLQFFLENKEQLLKRACQSITVILIEEDPILLSIFLHHFDLTPYKGLNILLLEGADIDRALASFEIASFKGLKLFPAAFLSAEEKGRAEDFAAELMTAARGRYSNMLTMLNFENVWARNTLKNLSASKRPSSILALNSIMKGQGTAVLAGGGPTLKRSIPILKEGREGFVLICVDTAYAPLMKAGIVPDVVVCVDAGFYNYYDFLYENGAFPCLALDLSAYPDVSRKANARRSFFFISSSPDKDNSFQDYCASSLGLELGRLNVSSTVSSAALDLAMRMDAEKVLLCGMDFSYPEYESHCAHTLAYEYYSTRSGKLMPLEGLIFASIMRKRLQPLAKSLYSDYTLASQLRWFENAGSFYRGRSIFRLRFNAAELKGADIDAADFPSYLTDGSRERFLCALKELPTEQGCAAERKIDFFTELSGHFEEALNFFESLSSNKAGTEEKKRRMGLFIEGRRSLSFLKTAFSFYGSGVFDEDAFRFLCAELCSILRYMIRTSKECAQTISTS